jgi:hypothetical protein
MAPKFIALLVRRKEGVPSQHDPDVHEQNSQRRIQDTLRQWGKYFTPKIMASRRAYTRASCAKLGCYRAYNKNGVSRYRRSARDTQKCLVRVLDTPLGVSIFNLTVI